MKFCRGKLGSIWILAILCSGILASARAQGRATRGRELTVERIYSAPPLAGGLAQGIEWAPDASRISFFAPDQRGETALWVMDAKTGARGILLNSGQLRAAQQPTQPKAIQATGLGRAPEVSYMWAPGARSLLFIGSDNLALVDLQTKHARLLVSGQGEIADPKFSPDGSWVSYVKDSNLWVVNVASGQSRALTTGGSEDLHKGELDWVYPEELDASTGYWWAPDSQKLAYYEMDERRVTHYPIFDMSSPAGAIEYTQYPQAGETNPAVRVGVASVGGGETTWMDTGADADVYLPRVVWLRDAKQVAIERLNRAQNRLDLLFCAAEPGGGSCRDVLTETDPYWINISDDLYFFADGKRFLWSSERGGFRHYYIYDLSGKPLGQLTSGDWQISGTGGFGPGAGSHPAVDEARGLIYFLSNKDNVRETQLYRVSLADKSITRITRQAGTHAILFAPDASGFVDTFSTATQPPRQDLCRMDGERVATVHDNGDTPVKQFGLSPVEFLTVAADDGTKLQAEMIKPPDFDANRKYPVLVAVYGGPQAQSVRNEWSGANFLWHEMMAQKGYIVFTLDNRGSYNRGHAFETPVFHHFGKIELADQLAGVRYLKALPYVDPSRIGIWGWSYGGYMTLYAMTHAPGVFKAGVAVAPVTDWRLYDTIYTERYMGTPQENAAGYRDSSPVNQARNLSGKLMIVHGTGDDNVHFANTSEWLNAMIAGGKYPDAVMIFPGRGHPIGDRAARIQLFERITQFFQANL